MFGTKEHLQGLPLLLLALCRYGVAIRPLGYQAQEVAGQQPLERFENGPKSFDETLQTIPTLLDGVEVLQDQFFDLWPGVWPTSIDWTSAVIGTYLSGSLSSLTKASIPLSKAKENTINKYYSQLVASYFGQDSFSLRQEAYDDMLWVVLGWLESIKFVNTHTEIHYSNKTDGEWYGTQWVPAFAHRARLFWELASQGWETSLCDGGMIWSPWLTPYKNAITNELYIAASISMYLYFPGDSDTSPYGETSFPPPSGSRDEKKRAPSHERKYLTAAVDGYKWLVSSNMTNSKGLYVDGFHISGWRPDGNHIGTKCDERNEMVYTYNQGVLLTGQKGLYEATGTISYLKDGHKLISSVIAATGWNLDSDSASSELDVKLGKWHGLGRSGILEESCDAEAHCSQDSQTFKGIFFHHLTAFCQPVSKKAVDEVSEWHSQGCSKYRKWIKHNAHAALKTRDDKGRFGMWWGAPSNSKDNPISSVMLHPNAVDYRNAEIPTNWKITGRSSSKIQLDRKGRGTDARTTDLNDRGIGRTVETQGGGIAVVRALWELVDTT